MIQDNTLAVRRRQAIGLAGAVLGWRPEVPLRDALARTCAWYRDELARTEGP